MLLLLLEPPFGPTWGPLGPLGALLQPSWRNMGAFLGPSGLRRGVEDDGGEEDVEKEGEGGGRGG